MPTVEETVSTLNNLIQTCRDGEEGFRTAATNLGPSDVRELCKRLAAQRGGFVRQLQDLVREMGLDPESSGSATGAMHRGWINIRAAVGSRDEQAVLAECERGEDAALNNYEDALSKELDDHIMSVFRRQYEEVRRSHDAVRAMRDRTTAGERGVGHKNRA